MAWDTVHDYYESLQRFLTNQGPDYGTLIDNTHDSDGHSKWKNMTQQCLEQWKLGDTVPDGAIGGKIDIGIKEAKDDAVRSVPSTPFSERPRNGRFHFTADERHMLEGVEGKLIVFVAPGSNGLLKKNPIFSSVQSYSDADVRQIRKAMSRHVLQMVERCAQRSSSRRKVLPTEEEVRQASAALVRWPVKSGFSLTSCLMLYTYAHQYGRRIQDSKESSEKGGTSIELGTQNLEEIWADIPADTSSGDAPQEHNPFSDSNASELDSDVDAKEEGNPFSDGNRLSPESDDRTL